jgi:hypothetical protein
MHPQTDRLSSSRGILAAAAAAFGVLMISPVPLRAEGSAGMPSARAAKAFSLNENGNLQLTSKHGFTLNEKGSASGTIRGTIYVHLTIVSTRRVSAEISIYPHGGSITVDGTASYHKGSTSASFAGSMSVNRGTGTYAHAKGQGLSFSGTIQKSNDAVTVQVSGKGSD